MKNLINKLFTKSVSERDVEQFIMGLKANTVVDLAIAATRADYLSRPIAKSVIKDVALIAASAGLDHVVYKTLNNFGWVKTAKVVNNLNKVYLGINFSILSLKTITAIKDVDTIQTAVKRGDYIQPTTQSLN